MTLLLNNSLKGAPGWLSGLKRHVDQWIRVECPDMDHQLYVQKIFDKAEKLHSGKRQPLQSMVLEKLDSYVWKNDTQPFSYTIHKDKFEMDKRPQREAGIYQNPIGEHRQ